MLEQNKTLNSSWGGQETRQVPEIEKKMKDKWLILLLPIRESNFKEGCLRTDIIKIKQINFKPFLFSHL
jgi:hypothetical protein